MIHVIDDFYIEPDDTEWQSFRYGKYKTRKGDEKWRKSDVRYHNNLFFAVKRIMEDCKKRSLVKKECELNEAVADLKLCERETAAKIISAIESLADDK